MGKKKGVKKARKKKGKKKEGNGNTAQELWHFHPQNVQGGTEGWELEGQFYQSWTAKKTLQRSA